MARNMEKVWAMADEVETLGHANIDTDAESERRADLAAQAKVKVESDRADEKDYQEATATMEKMLAQWVTMGRMERINWIRRIRYGGEWL